MKLKTLLALCFALFIALHPTFSAPIAVYVSEGAGKRISIYHMDASTGDLTHFGHADLPGSPGSLAVSRDHRHLYASIRSGKQFATLPIDAKTGALGSPVLADAGFNAAYVHVDRTGQWLLAAAYGEGVVGVSEIKEGIVQAPPIVTLETGKKAHSIQTDPTNRFAFVPHVGELNKVEQLRFDPATGMLSPNSPPHMPGGEGQGPRHMQFHPNGKWAYFVNEQGKSVTLCGYDSAQGTMKIRQTVSTVPPDWDITQGSCADIHVSADGRFVYASNRGHDSLAVFSVNPESGELTSHGQTPTEKTPRSFCLVPRRENFVVSAGQGSGRLIVYRRDTAAGTLTPLKTYDCGKDPGWVLAIDLTSENTR